MFARTFYSVEKDIAKLADVLGHSNINTTRLYIITTFREHCRIIEKMRLYIRKNITRNLTLEEISSNCSISTSYASRIFKKHTNITIKEYINNEKLYYARELLQNTSMNISEISNYLGYCDAFYFSTLFKRKFGKSPKQFFR